MVERTAEFKEMQSRGEHLDLKVAKRICNTGAGDLEAYAAIMDAEVPIFAARFKDAIESYAKAVAMLPDFSSGDAGAAKQLDDAIQTAAGLRGVMDEAAQSLAGFRQAIAALPRMTTQYNRAKRHALSILDTYLGEMKSGSNRLVECQKVLGAMRAELPTPST